MSFTNLILVDGIFGAGKSTLTELISNYLNQIGIDNIFYEEEEVDNPFYIDGCEDVKGRAETDRFIDETINRWRKFIGSIYDDKKVYIVESSFFQNSLRILFNNCYIKEEIEQLHNGLVGIMNQLNPILIYLHIDDVSNHIKHIWKIRGEEWKRVCCINQDQDTLYCDKNRLTGDDSTIVLWDDFQKLSDQLFEKVEFRKKNFILKDPVGVIYITQYMII